MHNSRFFNDVRFLLAAGCAALLVLAGCSHTRSTAEDEPTADADEVNVGYGTQSKDAITGSVSSVRTQDNDRPVSRPEELLQGRVAGVMVRQLPNGNISVTIRGRNSFMGSNEPLYVVDGMVISAGPGGSLEGVAPGDIERIDVLKDASATAIYGSRGGNGVILVTTKRGH